MLQAARWRILPKDMDKDPKSIQNPTTKKRVDIGISNLASCFHFVSYCWWTKSCTTKDDDYPIIYRVLTIPAGCLGFLPSTVPFHCLPLEDDPYLMTEPLEGLRFFTPVGLAPGLDPLGEGIPAFFDLGFGFVEARWWDLGTLGDHWMHILKAFPRNEETARCALFSVINMISTNLIKCVLKHLHWIVEVGPVLPGSKDSDVLAHQISTRDSSKQIAHFGLLGVCIGGTKQEPLKSWPCWTKMTVLKSFTIGPRAKRSATVFYPQNKHDSDFWFLNRFPRNLMINGRRSFISSRSWDPMWRTWLWMLLGSTPMCPRCWSC